MARDLYRRLKRLRENTGAANAQEGRSPGPTNGATAHGPANPPDEEALAAALNGWQRVAPLVYTRRTEVAVEGPGGESTTSRLLGREIPLADLCFMDTETSGLSGGAGTSVFLVGSGSYANGAVLVDQVLLADFPGEPDFLSVVREHLWKAKVWVSYNGKSFDARLLETRFLMNGQQVILPGQLDLLYWSRRLWKSRIGGCSLGNVEQEILGTRRVGDVDGFEIPDRYFEFLRTGDPAGLIPVFSHHLQDIVSLVRLYFHIESILVHVGHSGRATSALGVDRVALGRYMVARGMAGGERLLRDAVHKPVAEESLRERERAAMALSRVLRRAGRTHEALVNWKTLWTHGSPLAGVEVAKYLEHGARDIEAALELSREVLQMDLGDRFRAELMRRLARLQRKSAN